LVIDAGEKEGLSQRAAAARFGVSDSVAIAWVKRFRETGRHRARSWADISRLTPAECSNYFANAGYERT
jgi:transposase